MKRVSIGVLMFVVLSAGLATATETRVRTLGENYDTLRDEDNIWLYPSTLVEYPNLMIGEVRMGEFGKGGGHWGIGSFVLGAYFNTSAYSFIWEIPELGTLEAISIDQRIDFFYGRHLGDLPFGLRLSLWGEGSKKEDDPQTSQDPNYENSYSRFELASGLTAMDGKLDLAGSLGRTGFEEKEDFDDPTTTEYRFLTYTPSKSDGSLDLSLRGRYWHTISPQWTLVPHASFGHMTLDYVGQMYYQESGTVKFFDDEKAEFSVTAITLGVGTNYAPSPKVLTVTDVGLMFASSAVDWTSFYTVETDNYESHEFKSKPKLIPYFKMGLEGKVKSWLAVRVGVVSEWHSTTQEYVYEYRMNQQGDDEKKESSTSGVMARTYLGAGFQFGDFAIDTDLDASFLNNGPYFITGASTDDGGAGWAARVAFRYDFAAED